MNNVREYVALIVASTIWGFSTPIGKFALDEVPISILLFLRYFISLILLVTILLLAKKTQYFALEDFKKIAFAGFIVTIVNIGLFYIGLNNASAIDAAIIYNLVPILTIILAIIFFKDKPSIFDISGILLAFIGTFIIVGQPYFNDSFEHESTTIGLIIMFVAALSAAGYSFLGHDLPRKYNMINVTLIFFIIGTLGTIPFAVYEAGTSNFSFADISTNSWLAVLYLAIFGTTIAYILWTWGLERVKPSQVNIFVYIQPIASIILAVPLLGEKVTAITILGITATFIGIYIASYDDESQLDMHKHNITRRN